jgi:chorismate-pyruvate lyase
VTAQPIERTRISALDILERLEGLQFRGLDPLQRILLITDGTLTEILEATLLEPISLVKVAQDFIPAAESDAMLEPEQGEIFMERQILLRGSRSGRNYVYAKSVLAVDRLGSKFRDELLESQTPLGRLWLEHKLETFKELLEVRCLAADGLARHFDCPASGLLLARTYRVYSRSRPVMSITEYFPISYNQCVALKW